MGAEERFFKYLKILAGGFLARSCSKRNLAEEVSTFS